MNDRLMILNCRNSIFVFYQPAIDPFTMLSGKKTKVEKNITVLVEKNNGLCYPHFKLYYVKRIYKHNLRLLLI